MCFSVLKNNSSRIAIAASAIALFGVPAAIAATTSTTFNVTATVPAVCSVVATDLAFGNYDASSATPNDASSTVTVTCSNGALFDVGLDSGNGSGATVLNRKMTSGINTLAYQMYTNAGRTQIWGDGSLGTNTQGGLGNASAQAYTVYGRIAAAQFVNSGAYADLVTATVTY